ncbi:MAG: T9SS type A sorting domain-containing protein [Saprospiraceae bacterium]
MKNNFTLALALPMLCSLFLFTNPLLAQGPSACDQFDWIECGDTLLNQTTQGFIGDFNNVNSYICIPDDPNNPLEGFDRLYKIVVAQPMSLRFVLEILDSTDLDLVFGLNCPGNPTFNACRFTIERNQITGIYREVLDVYVETPGTYSLIVDGDEPAGHGDYNLIVDCSCTCVEPSNDAPIGEVVYCDDFENYLPNKALDPQSSRWMKWDSLAVDAVVSPNGFAGQGTRFQTVGSSKPRLIYQLQDNNTPPAGTGRYRVSWKMNIAAGKTARYNMLHRGPQTSFINWAYHVTFAANNTGQLRIANPNNAPIATFPFPSGTWMNVMQIVDMSKDSAELWINNNYVARWKFSTGYNQFDIPQSENRLNAIEFVSETNTDFRVDNICIWRKTGNCTGDLPVCVDNGLNYSSTNAARCDLYTSLEFTHCNSVCDYGGTFIYRGDKYDGVLDASDFAPELVRIDPCVVSAYGGNVPTKLYADIYVFSKKDTLPLDLIVNSPTPANIKTFVFSCNSRNPDGSCTTGQRCLAEIGTSNVYTPLTCDSFYYIVVTSGGVGTAYDLNVLPNGPCGTNAELLSVFCSDFPGSGANSDTYTVSATSAPGFDTQTQGNVYETCYGGSLPYSGGEKIFKFVLTHPAAIRVRVESDVQIGVFLYAFLCGKECVDYAETEGNGEQAYFTEFLTEGTYFIVVDKAFDSPTSNDFEISVECTRKSYFDIVKELGCGVSFDKPSVAEQSSQPYDPKYCDCASYFFSHYLNIKSGAYDFAADDYIQFLYRDTTDGNLTSSARLTKKWDAPPGQDKEYILSSTLQPLQNEDTKCSHYGGDTIFIWLTQTSPGSRNFKEMAVVYEDPATTPGVNATNRFVVDTLPGNFRSSISSMNVLNTVTFGGTSFGRTVSPTTTQISTAFASSIPWYIEVDPPVDWLSVSPLSGGGGGSYDITVDMDENTSALTRRTILRFISVDRPDMYRYAMEIRQDGVCIPASVTIQQTPAVVCEGDSVTLKAFVGFDPNNPDSSLARQYAYRWEPSFKRDSVIGLSAQNLALGDNTYSVTVTNNNRNCNQSAADTITFTVGKRPTTPTAASPVSVRLCADEQLPTLAVTVQTPSGQPTPTVNWYDQPQGGILLKENSLTYKPTQYISAQYYAEAQNPGGCPSLTRRQFTVTVDPLPSLSVAGAACDSTHLTYSFTATTDGTDLSVNIGQKTFANGTYTIFNVPIASPVQVTAVNAFCDTIAQVLPPTCVCSVGLPQSGGDQTVCDNQPVPPLMATATGPHETVDWYAAPTGGTVLPGGQGTSSFQATTAGPYFAQGRNTLNGCVSAARTEVRLTINPTPSLTVTDTVCALDLSDYQISVSTSPAAALSISPQNAGTVSGSNGAFTVSDITVGQDIVLTATDPATGCARSLTVLAPDCACLTIPAPVSGGNAAVCPGQPFPALTVTVASGLSANWFNANSVAVASDTLSFVPFAPGTYFAQAIDPASGCVSAGQTALTLSIHPLPPLSAATPQCAPNRQAYSVAVTTAPGVSLSASSGVLAGDNGVFAVSGVAVGTALVLTATDDVTGCTRDTVVVSPACPCVQNIPPPGSPGTVEICAGEPIPMLSVTVGSDQTADWYNALGGTLALGTLQYQPAGAGIFSVKTRDTISNCTSTDAATVSLVINPLPGVQVAAKNCDSTLLTYTVALTTQPGVGITPSLGTLAGSNGQFLVYNVPANSNLTITALNGQTDCSASLLVTAPVCTCDTTILPPETGGNKSVCAGQAFPSLTVNVGMGQTAVWYNAAGVEVGQGQAFAPTAAGTYFAETRKLVDDCRSLTRTAVSLTVNPAPTLVLADTICSDNLLTYSLEVLTDGTDIQVAPAYLKIPTGPGAFVILNIPVGAAVTITALNANTNCMFARQVVVNLCPCPAVAAPTNLGDQEICEGDPLPMLRVSVDKPTHTADWYTTTTGGVPIISGGIGTLNFQPVQMQTRTYYAQTRDTETNCLSAGRTPVTLTVRAPATVSAGPDRAVCAGEQVPLSVTLNGVDGGTWSANVPGGVFFPNNNAASAQHYLPPAGAGTVTLTLTSTDPPGPCPPVSDAMIILVHSLPTIMPDTAYCAPNLQTYSVEFLSDALSVTPATGVLSALGNNRYRVSGIGKGAALTVMAENADCSAQTTFPVLDCACPEVNPPAVPPIVSVCADKPIPVISAQAGADETVDWYSAETGGILLASDTAQYQPGFAGLFFAQARNRTHGCTSARAPVEVEIRQLPMANAGPDQAVCPGGSAILIATDGTGYSFLWSTGASTQSVTVSPSATTTYFLDVTRAGCEASDSVVVTVSPAVSVAVEQVVPIQCFGGANGVIQANMTGGTPGFSYEWSNSSVLQTVGALPAGMYTVTATDNAGCTAIATYLLAEPAVLVIANVNTTNATPGQADGALQVAVQGGLPPYSYAWFQNDTLIVGQKEPLLDSLPVGFYEVTITDSLGCTVASAVLPIGSTEAGDPKWSALVVMYPNPTTGMLHIRLDLPSSSKISTRVLDAIGREVLGQEHGSRQTGVLTLDLSQQATGIYFVQLLMDDTILTRKINLTKH